jgi:hypothetical protein
MTHDTFLGKPVSYWVELQARADADGVTDLLRDLADAHAKVYYYESMLDRMHAYRSVVDAGRGK